MNAIEQQLFEHLTEHLNPKWEPLAKQTMALQNPDTMTLLFAADPHYIRHYSYYAPVYFELERMVEFSGYVGADVLAIAGDLADGNTPLENEYRDLYDVVSLVRKAKVGSVVLSKGNHDDCAWYSFQHDIPVSESVIDAEQWFNHVINPLRAQYPILLDDENPAGGYYAVDDAFHKIRLLNLNTNDYPLLTKEDGTFVEQRFVGQWNFGMQEPQLRWMAKMLQVPEGWSVLTVSHTCPFHAEGGEGFYNAELVLQLLKAFKNGEKGTLVSQTPHFEAQVPYDFTGAQSHDFLCCLCGHSHKDEVEVAEGFTTVHRMNLLGTRCHIAETWCRGDNIKMQGGFDVMLLDKKKRVLRILRSGLPEQNLEISF